MGASETSAPTHTTYLDIIIHRMLRALIACSRRRNLEPPTLLDLVARSLYAQRANNAHGRADQWAQLPMELRELVEAKILVHLARRTLLFFSCALHTRCPPPSS
jgi:hypothetical protein